MKCKASLAARKVRSIYGAIRGDRAIRHAHSTPSISSSVLGVSRVVQLYLRFKMRTSGASRCPAWATNSIISDGTRAAPRYALTRRIRMSSSRDAISTPLLREPAPLVTRSRHRTCDGARPETNGKSRLARTIGKGKS